ncbi:MAG TPA: hypothetical protein VHV52_09085 [Gaiellaceae bacterium]|jgi:hypothetical protein|nr:hypothetical protein [Gaiellaceae bacterium]
MPKMRTRGAGAAVVVVLLAALGAHGAGAAAGPALSAGPTVTGTLQVGKKLTALPGTWLGSGTVVYAFQWYRCDQNAAHCSSIHGATKATYTEVAKDAAHSLGLTVNAKDANGTTPAYAPVTGLVAAATAKLAATAQPALAGDPIVGTSIDVQAPTWSATPTATSYAWLRCNANGRACAPIAGQTASSYTLTTADLTFTVVCSVTSTLGTEKQTVLTLRSDVVRQAPGPVLSAGPTVSGTLQQGKKLTAFPGTWTSGGAITYAYQWYRCDPNGAHCSSIHGSTKSTYTAVAKDVGQSLGVTVRATDSTGTTPAYAALVGLIAAPSSKLVATTQTGLAGDAAVGTALTAQAPTWSPTPTATTYAWLRCNTNGRACVAIAGQTTGSYTLTTDDVGHTIIAAITGTAGTAKQTALSLPSALVHA